MLLHKLWSKLKLKVFMSMKCFWTMPHEDTAILIWSPCEPEHSGYNMMYNLMCYQFY